MYKDTLRQETALISRLRHIYTDMSIYRCFIPNGD